MENKNLLDFFTIENKNGLKTIEKNLLKNYPDLCESINNWSKSIINLSFKEKIYIFIYKLTEKQKCLECGKETNFTNSLKNGYRKFCSKTCSGKCSETLNNREKTCILKFGVSNVLLDEKIKNKISQTNNLKYGCDNVFSSKEIKNKIANTLFEKYGTKHYSNTFEFKEKYKNTMFVKYGVYHYSKTDDYKFNYKKTMIEKYGVDNPLKSDIIKNNMVNNNNIKLYNKFIKNGYKIIGFGLNELKIKHTDGHIFTDNRKFLINRFNTGLELSKELLPKYSSNGELEIQTFLIENNINILCNKRKILGNSEIDIYIPNNKLGIEFNGLYWHSTAKKDNFYHLKKTELCENNNIQLLHIFEDEWQNKKEIVKSIIKSKLGIYYYKIFARKTIIKELDINTCREFLNNNHLQGSVNSKIKLGLYYNDELISVMTFGNKRIVIGNKTQVDCEYEMLRFCNKLNTTIIGGASKLLKYFIRNYKPKSIISFADRRYSNGGLYKELGFNFLKNTKPNYFYIKNNELIRHHRFGFRKDILVMDGSKPSLTEFKIMDNRKYLRIYDCGCKKYILKL